MLQQVGQRHSPLVHSPAMLRPAAGYSTAAASLQHGPVANVWMVAAAGDPRRMGCSASLGCDDPPQCASKASHPAQSALMTNYNYKLMKRKINTSLHIGGAGCVPNPKPWGRLGLHQRCGHLARGALA